MLRVLVIGDNVEHYPLSITDVALLPYRTNYKRKYYRNENIDNHAEK